MSTALLAACAPAPAREPVRSLLEARQEGVVIQGWDLSCGAAALATLLWYQHGNLVTEREVALGLIDRPEYLADPELVQRRFGFSLLDLTRYVEQRGYKATGYGEVTIEDLRTLAPAIVVLDGGGYPHFVVVRSISATRVDVADPAWGNRSLTIGEFERSWLAVGKLGRVAFVVSK